MQDVENEREGGYGLWMSWFAWYPRGVVLHIPFKLHISEHMMHFNPRSKSFRRGFLDGFTPQYTYFRGLEFQRAMHTDASIRTAWIKVGEALKQAEKTERGKFGEETRRAR